MPCNFSSFLLKRKPVQRNDMHVFKTFRRTVRILRVNEIKLTLEKAFIGGLLRQEVKKDQIITKEFFFGAPGLVLACIKTHSLRNIHIKRFPRLFYF